MAKSRPRILFFSQHWPHIPAFASELRTHHVRKALENVGDVDIVVLDAEGPEARRAVDSDTQAKIVEVAAVSSLRSKSFAGKLRWAFDSRSHHPQGQFIDSVSADKILGIVPKYDLVWFSKIRTASMISHWKWPNSVLDIDDVPSTRETSVLQGNCNYRQRALALFRRWVWRRRERHLSNRFSVLGVCSLQDKSYLEGLGINAPIRVIPNGFDPPEKEVIRNPATPPRIGFTGLFDYYPNVEGIHWFVDKCWSSIRNLFPDARLRLVGRSSDGALKPAGPNIDGLGWVEDLDSEMATWSLMVVPILVGAGTRLKIAMGFSRKCPIVSTSIGAYGYDLEHGEDILLADKPDAFADACKRLILQPDAANTMAEKASRKFHANWSWNAITPAICKAAEDCLRIGKGQS